MRATIHGWTISVAAESLEAAKKSIGGTLVKDNREVRDHEQWVKTATEVFAPFALQHGGVRACRSATTVVYNEKAKCKYKVKGKHKAKCKEKAVRKQRDARWICVKSAVGGSKVKTKNVDNTSAGGDSSTRDNSSRYFMFKVLETIGTGGYGKVYKVEVLSTKVQSAVGDGTLTQFCAVNVQTPTGRTLILDKQHDRELCIMMQPTKAASAVGGEMHIVPRIMIEKHISIIIYLLLVTIAIC